MDSELLWLWLCNIDGIGNKKIGYLLKMYKTPLNIWNLSQSDIKDLKFLNSKDKIKFINSRDEKKIIQYNDKCIKDDIYYYSIDSELYPNILRDIYDPPYIIYVRGDIKCIKDSIAIVGSRKCSYYGSNIAKKISSELSERGITIVSGLAKGIDANAHIGALQGMGSTVAVLGTGVDICYPIDNIDIYKAIINKGCVISEYPIGTRPKPGLFPIRNRIISGLSRGVVVVEASKKSGSLITADLALDQGKDVYAIPGNITSNFSIGTNNLIKQGAKLVTSFEDVFEDIAINHCTKIKKNIDLLADDENIVYDCIDFSPINIDIIQFKTKLSLNDLQYILLNLELKGFINKLPCNNYVRNL